MNASIRYRIINKHVAAVCMQQIECKCARKINTCTCTSMYNTRWSSAVRCSARDCPVSGTYVSGIVRLKKLPNHSSCSVSTWWLFEAQESLISVQINLPTRYVHAYTISDCEGVFAILMDTVLLNDLFICQFYSNLTAVEVYKLLVS